jgi:CRP-like cAMP-binding protein
MFRLKTISTMQTSGPNPQALEELYRSLPKDVAKTAREAETRLIVPATTRLIYCGERPEHLIMLCAGIVEISLPCGDQAIVLSMAAPGRVFGLRALVTGKLPEIEAICRSECELRLLPEKVFTGTLKSNPQMYFAVAKLLSADLQLAQAYLKNRSRRKLRMAEGVRLISCDRA